MIAFSKLRDLEKDAIKIIQNNGAFGRLHSLSLAAKKTQISTGPKAPIDINLNFTLPTRLREDSGRNLIHRNFQVGCFAVPSTKKDEVQQLTYSVLIGRDSPPERHVARKFHFDFEPASQRNGAEPKPTFHFQMCGKLSPHHLSDGYADKHIAHLLPAWSQPRVPAQPTSLALVLNWLFMEFGVDADVKAVRVDPHWLGLIRSTERAILKPYFEKCAAFLSSSADSDKSFFAKQLYEEP